MVFGLRLASSNHKPQATSRCYSRREEPSQVLRVLAERASSDVRLYLAAFSTPHQSAMNSAIAVVMRRSDAMLTRSSKPWMFSLIGP
jgi:hypothetical protein